MGGRPDSGRTAPSPWHGGTTQYRLAMVWILLVGLAFVAFPIWCLVDALRVSDQRWAAAGENKVLWVLLIVFLCLLGSLLYVLMPRPKLKRISS
jgi:hypothetical protein